MQIRYGGVTTINFGSLVIRECKRLVDELCWCGVKRLGFTNDTFERISRMLKWNRVMSFV